MFVSETHTLLYVDKLKGCNIKSWQNCKFGSQFFFNFDFGSSLKLLTNFILLFYLITQSWSSSSELEDQDCVIEDKLKDQKYNFV